MSEGNKAFRMAIAPAGQTPCRTLFCERLLNQGRRMRPLHIAGLEQGNPRPFLTAEHGAMPDAIRDRDAFVAFLTKNHLADADLAPSA
jgi:DNA-binding GntR family transcriptional regulator